MPYVLSPTATKSMLARETEEVWLACLTFTHPEIEDIKITNNNETILRVVGEYRPWPFEATLPDDTDEPNQNVAISIENIDREISRTIRRIQGERPKVRIEVVLASSPDTVERGPFDFSVLSAEGDVMTINLSVGQEEDFLNQGFPGQSYNPSNSQGLWP